MTHHSLARLVAAALAAVILAAGAQGALAQPGPAPVSLTAQLADVRLFDEARITGRLDPPHPGGYVVAALLLEGRSLGRHFVALASDGSTFETTIPVERWGRYRAEVTFEGDADHAPATVVTEPKRVRTPRPLHQGSRGPWVLALEDRLDELSYRVPRPNQSFDHRTADAVLAFRKVQGLSRGESVTRATWRRLADPRTPRPRVKRPREHIEVDQSKQVLYVVRQGEIDQIVHVSTGAGGATRDGAFNVHRKIAGFSPNRLYYPSYFDGLRAVHGWPDVPPSPASHGCVRVPYWVAKWIFGVMHYGMQVRVYH
jgi:hypothetical protein